MDDTEDDEVSEDTDTPCKCCQAICSFFPIQKVFDLEDYQVPCIDAQERIRIATRRAPQQSKILLTNALVRALKMDSYPCYPIFYASYMHRDGVTDRIKFLVRQGADVTDPKVRSTVVDAVQNAPGPAATPLDERSFVFLTGLGIPLTREDFQVVDIEELLCHDAQINKWRERSTHV
jgi:hypothetical protein